MKEELLSLLENKTYRLVKLPKRCKAIDSKWMFKTKRDTDGEISYYKARLIAQIFRQVKELESMRPLCP